MSDSDKHEDTDEQEANNKAVDDSMESYQNSLTEAFPDDDPEEDIEYVSKSELKRDAQACFRLGEKLCKLPTDTLMQLIDDEAIIKSVALANKIKAHGGKKRQLKHLAKLIRQSDWNTLEDAIQKIEGGQRHDVERFHEIEKWRDTLLRGGDDDINRFVEHYTAADRQQLRQIIRLAKKELQAGTAKKYQRQLFQLLKPYIEDGDT